MTTGTVRTDPPSREANNTDVFMWAVYLLGGATRQVDVEDVYFKAFELAPNRLGWRTRPDVPNFKKTAKALQEIEAKSHVGLLQKLGPNYRRLTPEGVQWVDTYREVLQEVYGAPAFVPAPRNSNLEAKRKEIMSNQVWAMWCDGKNLGLKEIAYALNCSMSASEVIWLDRLADLDSLATATNQKDLTLFAKFARSKYMEEKK